ncbi:MAG: polysaccharide biosynthesis protein [Clostridia bacterium]|nr:polysaccharide biosynthesis protein [Clostridia bacterium]
MVKENKGGFLKGAAIIAAGGLIAKLIGALYRIPLTNLIGGHGMGLYQMIYPVYCLLLTVSATGIPSSIAKLTAERVSKGEGDKPLFSTAMKLFVFIGLGGSLLMALIAPFLAKAQGNTETVGGYYALAPSVLLVSAISVFRGWFQGKNDMLPTALSEVTEQVVKVAFGLLFAYLFRENVARAVVFLLLAVSISELAALCLMLLLFQRVPAPLKLKNGGGMVKAKTVLKLSIPVTFSSILLPLSGLVDSVLAVRLLSAYSTDAVALYGLFAGGAVTVINLPVSVCYGLAAASVPAVASAAAEGKGVKRKLFFALGITALVSIPCAVGLYFFAEPAARLIFRSLQGEELTLLIGLIQAFSVSAFLLSCVQTLSACLTAQGKPKFAALGMLAGVVAKTVTYAFLLRDSQISVYGLAYATNLCYLVAFLLDLLYNLIVSKNQKKRSET